MTMLHIIGSIALIFWFILTLLNWIGLDYKWWKTKVAHRREK